MATTDLDEARQELRKLVRDFLATVPVRDVLEGRIDSDVVWKRLARELQIFELAIPSAPADEAPGLPELVIVFEELGRALTPGPYLSTLGLGLPALCLTGEVSLRRVIDRVVAGDAVVAVIDRDHGISADDPHQAPTVSGVAERVMDAPAADFLIVPVRSAEGVSLALIDVESPGVRITAEEPFDPTMRFGRVELSETPVTRVGDGHPDMSGVLERVETRARVALAGFHVGLARACVTSASEYALVRHQFDRPIGSFQSIKHLLADIHRRTEAAAILTHRAAWAAHHDPDAAALVVHLAAAEAADAAFESAASSIQIHGGIGFTWEHDAQLYFKRATAGRMILGTPDEHREAAADLLLRDGVEA